MLTKESMTRNLTTLVIVMIALAVHQKYVAPMLSPKAPAKV